MNIVELFAAVAVQIHCVLVLVFADGILKGFACLIQEGSDSHFRDSLSLCNLCDTHFIKIVLHNDASLFAGKLAEEGKKGIAELRIVQMFRRVRGDVVIDDLLHALFFVNGNVLALCLHVFVCKTPDDLLCPHQIGLGILQAFDRFHDFDQRILQDITGNILVFYCDIRAVIQFVVALLKQLVQRLFIAALRSDHKVCDLFHIHTASSFSLFD